MNTFTRKSEYSSAEEIKEAIPRRFIKLLVEFVQALQLLWSCAILILDILGYTNFS
jgi:hypothetical protein